jgi:hypothetical protein
MNFSLAKDLGITIDTDALKNTENRKGQLSKGTPMQVG